MSVRERENKSLGMWIHSLFWVTTPDNKDGVPLHQIAKMTYRLFFSNVPSDQAKAVSENIRYWTHVDLLLDQRPTYLICWRKVRYEDFMGVYIPSHTMIGFPFYE